MKINKLKIPGYTIMLISIILIVLSFFRESYTLLWIGSISIVVSIFFNLIISSIELFKKDKELDIEDLKRQGLTIVKCHECLKDNVYEDKYCIYCGEKLVSEHETIQN